MPLQSVRSRGSRPAQSRQRFIASRRSSESACNRVEGTMAPEQSHEDEKNVWRKQHTEDTVMTLANIHERAQKFQTQVRRRNVREYIAVLVVVLVFGFYFW